MTSALLPLLGTWTNSTKLKMYLASGEIFLTCGVLNHAQSKKQNNYTKDMAHIASKAENIHGHDACCFIITSSIDFDCAEQL
jgi:hypothetical protein